MSIVVLAIVALTLLMIWLLLSKRIPKRKKVILTVTMAVMEVAICFFAYMYL